MQRVAVIDYGGSNLRSVAKALESVGDGDHEVVVSGRGEDILAAERVVFPGQGAVGDCMAAVAANGLETVIRECIASRPFFGICLGLQSLLTTSDEDGGTPCLDIVPGTVVRFPSDPPPAADGSPQKIPHMGWNRVHWRRRHPLLAGVEDGERYYFVHSYYVVPSADAATIGETDYIERFTAAIASGYAFATQFHPEKSAGAGLRLLRNFLAWNGADA